MSENSDAKKFAFLGNTNASQNFTNLFNQSKSQEEKKQGSLFKTDNETKKNIFTGGLFGAASNTTSSFGKPTNTNDPNPFVKPATTDPTNQSKETENQNDTTKQTTQPKSDIVKSETNESIPQKNATDKSKPDETLPSEKPKTNQNVPAENPKADQNLSAEKSNIDQNASSEKASTNPQAGKFNKAVVKTRESSLLNKARNFLQTKTDSQLVREIHEIFSHNKDEESSYFTKLDEKLDSKTDSLQLMKLFLRSNANMGKMKPDFMHFINEIIEGLNKTSFDPALNEDINDFNTQFKRAFKTSVFDQYKGVEHKTYGLVIVDLLSRLKKSTEALEETKEEKAKLTTQMSTIHEEVKATVEKQKSQVFEEQSKIQKQLEDTHSNIQKHENEKADLLKQNEDLKKKLKDLENKLKEMNTSTEKKESDFNTKIKTIEDNYNKLQEEIKKSSSNQSGALTHTEIKKPVVSEKSLNIKPELKTMTSASNILSQSQSKENEGQKMSASEYNLKLLELKNLKEQIEKLLKEYDKSSKEFEIKKTNFTNDIQDLARQKDDLEKEIAKKSLELTKIQEDLKRGKYAHNSIPEKSSFLIPFGIGALSILLIVFIVRIFGLRIP